jgi:hypothetical protein
LTNGYSFGISNAKRIFVKTRVNAARRVTNSNFSLIKVSNDIFNELRPASASGSSKRCKITPFVVIPIVLIDGYERIPRTISTKSLRIVGSKEEFNKN